MTNPEWRIIKLAYNCLKVCFSSLASEIQVNIQGCDQILAETHGGLSAHQTPTIHKVFPLLEKVQSSWEALLENHEYQPVNHALEAGLQNMRKWYRKTDDTSIYFISHGNESDPFSSSTLLINSFLVLDPTRKLSYLNAAWESEWVETGMERMRGIVSLFIFLLENSDFYPSLQNIRTYIFLQKVMQQQLLCRVKLKRKVHDRLMVCNNIASF